MTTKKRYHDKNYFKVKSDFIRANITSIGIKTSLNILEKEKGGLEQLKLTTYMDFYQLGLGGFNLIPLGLCEGYRRQLIWITVRVVCSREGYGRWVASEVGWPESPLRKIEYFSSYTSMIQRLNDVGGP
ncbi:hypothetical protein ACFE04_020865 [Oxalis oulophora]